MEVFGEVVYQMVPWDVDFLTSKGLKPARPLFRFTLLTGSSHRLHLQHCQLVRLVTHSSSTTIRIRIRIWIWIWIRGHLGTNRLLYGLDLVFNKTVNEVKE